MDINIGNKNKVRDFNITENNIKVEVKEKQKSGVFKQIFVNVMSNLIWKVLGILTSLGILVLLSYLCMK